MISFSSALSFSFHKRSFIIGVFLFFLTFLLMVGFGYTLYKLGPEYLGVLSQMTEETVRNIAYIIYAIKTFFFSILSAYLFILAKKVVYQQPLHFSREFFYRVLLTVFGFKLILDLILYANSDSLKQWVGEKIITIALHPTALQITKVLTTALGILLLISFCITSLYMAYLINFNFSDFLKKLKYTFSSPLTFLKILALFIVFILVSLIPIIGLYFVLGSFDAQTVVMTFATCIMGTTSSVALLFYTILMATPIAIFCINTAGGRIFGSCVTLCYFSLYGILRLMGLPAIPISAILYIYVFFFILNLLYVTFVVIYPSFWIHLVAQGALEINQKFDPSVGISEEEKLLAHTTSNPL